MHRQKHKEEISLGGIMTSQNEEIASVSRDLVEK